MRPQLLLICAVTIAACAAPTEAPAPPATTASRSATDLVPINFDVIDLGGSVATVVDGASINAAGQIVAGGYLSIPPSGPAMVLGPNQFRSLGAYRGLVTVGQAINGRGALAGYVRTSDRKYRAFRWRPSAGYTLLGDGTVETFAYDLNDAGMVVGELSPQPTNRRALLWSATGVQRQLAGLGGNDVGARAIDQRGDVAGFSSGADGITHAVLWPSGGAPVDLTPTASFGLALDVSDSGYVVGQAKLGGEIGAFVWTAATGPRVIAGPLIQGTGFFYGVNNLGQAVGADAAGPIFWSAATGIVRLPTPYAVGYYSAAYDITDGGLIVGVITPIGSLSHVAAWQVR